MKYRLLLTLSAMLIALGAAAPAEADRGGHGGGHGGGAHGGGGHGGGGHRDWHGGGRGDWHGGHRGHGSIGLYFGSPLWWDPYPYPYYYDRYYDPPLVVEQSPPVYVQRPPEPAPQPNYWYYCPGFGYYPYVPSCPRPWMQVLPQPTQ